VQKLPCGALANVRPGSWTFGPPARSTAEGAVEERGEEVLGLTQCLLLHRTEGLDPLHTCSNSAGASAEAVELSKPAVCACQSQSSEYSL